MFKIIITATNRADIINLIMNTATDALPTDVWNVNSITRSEEDAHVEKWMDLDDWVDAKEWGKVDEAIMSGDVPTGSCVVVCDDRLNPVWGYVCGNGNEWFRVYLPEEVTVAILSMVHPNARYFVIDGLTAHTFENKTDLGMWLEEGFAACEGSEQRRYASMWNQVDSGKFVIDYNA